MEIQIKTGHDLKRISFTYHRTRSSLNKLNQVYNLSITKIVISCLMHSNQNAVKSNEQPTIRPNLHTVNNRQILAK